MHSYLVFKQATADTREKEHVYSVALHPEVSQQAAGHGLLNSGTRVPLRIWPLSTILASSSGPAVLSFFPLDSVLMASATCQPLTSSPKMV